MTFEEFIREWRDATPYIMVQTSGSTGTPKQIKLDKEFVRASALRTNSFFHIDSHSRLHSCVAPDFIGGKMMAVRAEEARCRLTWETPSNRPLAGITPDERIDLLAVVPSQMLHILDNLAVMPHLENIIIGGSAIDFRLRDRIIASGLNAYETYGMTETASHIALRKIEEGCDWFVTLPGISVSADARGCLVITFADGHRVITNDIAVIDGEGGFRVTGRADHVIVTGGKKVNPLEVEQRIAREIESPFRITSVPDEKWGRRVVLEIEGETGQEGEGEREDSDGKLLSRLRELLRSWEMPKEIRHVEALPRTPNGKIRH